MDIRVIVQRMFEPVITKINNFCLSVAFMVIASILVFFATFFIWYRINIFRLSPAMLEKLPIKFIPYDFLRWKLWDLLTYKKRRSEFREYGFSIFVGRQGAGKTISMVQYLNTMHKRYPACKIVTNFKYNYADMRMKSWKDFLEYRNGTKGVIFAIDEIHSEYSTEDWRNFPESLLSEISQQRKQRIKIVATSQVFSRVAKPIREQCFSVIVCSTYFGRLTYYREYDAAEYATSDTPYRVKKRCKPLLRSLYVQSNSLRDCYDTFEKIERMEHIDFIPRRDK